MRRDIRQRGIGRKTGASSLSLRAGLSCLLLAGTAALVLGGTLSDPEVDAYNVRLGTQTFKPNYGFTADTRLVETARAIREMGSDAVKFLMDRRNYPNQYGIPIPGSITNLAGLARDEPSCRQVLDLPFRHFLVWAYCFASTGDTWWKDGFSAAERHAEYTEIYGLTRHLLTNYNHSGKSFYLGHWEGDWYLISPANTAVNPSPTAIQGMMDWLNTRQQAVDDARREVPHSNVFVYAYAECNRVRDAMLNPSTSNQRVVNAVLPGVTNLDYVSWSSYDGMNLAAPDLEATLEYLQAHLSTNKAAALPGKRVIIGEYGWGGSLPAAAQEAPTRAYLQRLIHWGAPLILFWQMYDNEGRAYWLIDNTHTKTPCYFLHQRFLNRSRLLVARFKEQHGRLPASAEFADLVSPLLNQPLAAPAPLTVSNLDLTALTSTSATVSGSVAQGIYGDDQAAVWAFWGRQDGGTAKAAWEQSARLGINTNFNPKTWSAVLTNLAQKTNCFFRFYATNASGEAWAPASTPFRTGGMD